MDTSKLKERMTRSYYEQLKSLVPIKYREDISDAVLEKLDKAVVILAEQRDFVALADAFEMQLKWLKSTGDLVNVLCGLSGVPGVGRIIRDSFDAETDEFCQTFLALSGIINKKSRARHIVGTLQEAKEHWVDRAYWDIFRNMDYHAPDVNGAILQQLNCYMAKTPGTVAYELIAKRCQLCELFPDLRDATLAKELAEYRCDFLADKNPSEMDDFKDKIIHLRWMILRIKSSRLFQGS